MSLERLRRTAAFVNRSGGDLTVEECKRIRVWSLAKYGEYRNPINNRKETVYRWHICGAHVELMERMQQRHDAGQVWVRMSSTWFDPGVSVGLGNAWICHYSQLRYWGLIEAHPRSLSNGLWKLTEKGRLFLAGKLKVRKYVYLLHAGIFGWGGPSMSLAWCRKAPWDLKARMSDPERV